jgi:hypothetical protein
MLIGISKAVNNPTPILAKVMLLTAQREFKVQTGVTVYYFTSWFILLLVPHHP